MPTVQGQLEGDRLTEMGFVNNERNDYYPNEDPVILESPTANWTPDQVAQNIPAKGIDLDKLTIDNFEVNQYMKGGADGYDDGIGWWIGRDGEGISKLFFGDSSGNKVTWNGTTLSITGTLTATSINIPDTTTADSFHTDSDGNSWWGGNVATGYAGADAYILKDGTAKFSSLSIANTGIALQGIYGDGSDGNRTLGANATLTRDTFYNNLDVSTYTLNKNGYRLFVSGILSGSGKIINNGNIGGNGANASGASLGIGGIAGALATGNSVPSGLAGEPGGSGQAGVAGGGCGSGGGTVGDAGANGVKSIIDSNAVAGARGGDSGKLGACSILPGGVGGIAGVTSGVILNKINNLTAAYILSDTIGGLTNFNISPSSGGSGGGAGGQSYNVGDNGGGGGGGAGSGSSGGIVWLSARTITFTGTFESIGGDGGDGGDGGNGLNNATGGGGGGAGSGANGGSILIITSSMSATYTTDVSGGLAGTKGIKGIGGNGQHDGSDGSEGIDGNSGLVFTIII